LARDPKKVRLFQRVVSPGPKLPARNIGGQAAKLTGGNWLPWLRVATSNRCFMIRCFIRATTSPSFWFVTSYLGECIMLLAISSLKGFAIEAKDGSIGTVSDFLFDDRTWKLRWMVVDTGGWLTGRKVLVHPSVIGPLDYRREHLMVQLTKQQLKESPDILSDAPVSRQMQDSLYGYYGWDPLWGGSNYLGMYPYGMGLSPMSRRPYDEGAVLEADRADGMLGGADLHLRSVYTVMGYHIQATDGSIGHVENLMVETDNWGIRYLVIDTRNWWPGKRVLLSPYAVKSISWDDSDVLVNVTRDQIKASPAWDPAAIIDKVYEQHLHGYYGWPGYGW
jgi:hypothetical protein